MALSRSSEAEFRIREGWLFRWRVRNQTEKTMRPVSVRVPHGKFKAEESKFLPSVEIGAKNSFLLEVAVTCEQPPETVSKMHS